MLHDVNNLGAAGFAMLLPASDNARWTPSRKMAVVVAVRGGDISLDEACDRYMLSHEELANWDQAYNRHGIAGLHSKNRRWALSR